MFWQSSERCGTEACYKAYLEQYPQGRFVRLARARLEPTTTPTPENHSRDDWKPEMVAIRGGCFQMGSSASEEGRQDDERRHRVCVAEDWGPHHV